jgi:hypothetical protein
LELALNRPLEQDWAHNPARGEQFNGLNGPFADNFLGDQQGGDETILAGNISHDAGIAVDDHAATLSKPTDMTWPA